mmetsp:Transcript_66349/g.116240  ORF Transcript_66349/g.116240 Transcript_66349/m.116240 type:complete len:185 (-) Transcript_66349:47-601(-)
MEDGSDVGIHDVGASASPAGSPMQGADIIGYKVVAKVGDRYFSVWAGDSTEYRMGAVLRQPARPLHRGGLYVCRSADAAMRHRIPARRGGLYMAPRALLRCACEGPFVEYPGGKVACSGLTPLEELPLPAGYLFSRRPTAPARPLPPRPLSPAYLSTGPPAAMREETAALEAEVARMERLLGYR